MLFNADARSTLDADLCVFISENPLSYDHTEAE